MKKAKVRTTRKSPHQQTQTVLASLLAFSFVASASAATFFNPQLAFQGVLRSGAAFVTDGNYCAQLTLNRNGVSTWQKKISNFNVTNGVFSVSVSGNDDSAVALSSTLLQVTASNADTLTVDIKIDYSTNVCPGVPTYTDTYSGIPIYAVPTAMVADRCNTLVGALAGTQVTTHTLPLTAIDTAGATSGDVVTYDGTNWVHQAPAATGTGLSNGVGVVNIQATAGEGNVNIGNVAVSGIAGDTTNIKSPTVNIDVAGNATGAGTLTNTFNLGAPTTVAGGTTANVVNIGSGTTTAGTTTNTINIGTDASATDTITIGNTFGTSSLALKAGSGNIVISGNVTQASGNYTQSGNSSVTFGTGTGTTTLGSGTGTVSIAASTAGATAVNIGTGTTTGAVTIGNSTGNVAIGAGATLSQSGNSSVSLGTGTGTTTLGSGTGTVSIAASTGGATAVNIGTGTTTGAVTVGNATGGVAIGGPVTDTSAVTTGKIFDITANSLTSGNLLNFASSSATSSSLINLAQTSSTMTGNGVLMDFGGGGGTFSGNFVDFKVNGASKFSIDASGNITAAGNIGNGVGGRTNLTTAGAVPYVSASGVLSQDATKFFWDSTNHWLGVGTATPATNIHSLSTTEQLRLGYDAGNYDSFTVSSTGNLTIAGTGTNPSISLTPAGTGAVNLAVGTGSAATVNIGTGSTTGAVTIGNATGGVAITAGAGLTQSGNSSVSLGTGTGTTTLGSGTGTVSIAASTGGATAVNIGTGTTTGNLTLGNTTGSVTIAGAVTNSAAGAASTSGEKLSGAWFTGGGTTATKPQLLIEHTGTSTAWSNNGTGLGVNADNAFAGNLVDLQVNGTSKFSVDASGNITAAGNLGNAVTGRTNLTTAGAVPYVSASGVLNQDATNFFWDSTNHHLGIANATPTAAGVQNSTAGAALVSAEKIDGAWFSGGSATTTKPQLLVEPSTATSTGWSTAGTGLGVNSLGTFTGNLLDLQLNAATKFNVDYAGTMHFAPGGGGTGNAVFYLGGDGASGISMGHSGYGDFFKVNNFHNTCLGYQCTLTNGGLGVQTTIGTSTISWLDASTGVANTLLVYGLLRATANSDSLTGVVINPSFDDNSKTSVTHTLLNVQSAGTNRFKIDGSGYIASTPAASTSGSPNLVTLTGPAHTTLTASTEARDIDLNLARTVQFATGALATQRASYLQAPSYGFAGASTLTSASTMAISGPPKSQTNATITSSYGLNIEAGAVQPAGTVTNAYGLAVNAPTGATNNYAATFSGNVGIGNTAPATALDVTGQIRSLYGTTVNNNAAATTTIDWDKGNVQTSAFVCDGATYLVMNHFREGGSYTLIITGNATGSCLFKTTTGTPDSVNGAGGSWKFQPTNAAPTAATTTIYTFLVAGTNAYVSWITGF